MGLLYALLPGIANISPYLGKKSRALRIAARFWMKKSEHSTFMHETKMHHSRPMGFRSRGRSTGWM
jgi:hypothetical protein